MKKNFATFLLLLASTFVFAQGIAKRDSINSAWKTFAYSNYSIQYPSTWELSQSGEMKTSFILLSPLESAQDNFRENVNLLIQNLTENNNNLDTYTAISVNQIKTMLKNSNVIENERIKNGTEEYQKIIFTGDQGIFHLKFEQYYFIADNNAYVLTFTTEQNKFVAFKETGEKILNSFKLKK